MAINYTQAFNAGEVSRKLDGRNDLEAYKTGCRDLDNFFVLPQGGVERRAGSEFIQFAGTDGSNPARIIEFDFSSDVSYVIELGTDYAKVHYTQSGTDLVVNVTEIDNIDYTTTELRQIQFNRRFDTLILTCPTKETMVFKRTTITPTFTIEKISYTYPPLMEENITSTTIDASAASTSAFTGTNTLLASSAIFFKGHENSTWGLEHIRDADKKEIADTRNTNGEDANSNSLDVSFSNWSFTTDGTWNGSLVIQRSIAGGTYENYVVIADTTGGVSRNFTYASTTPEDANTRIRAKWVLDTPAGTFKFSLETDNIYHKGLVKITSVAGADVVIGTAALSSNTVTIDTSSAHGLSTNDYVLISGLGFSTTDPNGIHQITVSDSDTFTYALTGANESYTESSSSIIEATSRASATIVSMIAGIDDTSTNPAATVHWAEAAFSTYRGFSPASEFFENRLWLAGSKDEPADLFGSKFNEIFSFLTGTISTDAIKRTIDSPEEPKWLEGKRYLFLGTAGTAVSIRSANRDALITQDNITTLVENAYGSAALQAEIANDVIIYVQRDKLKIRELVYAQGQDTFVGNDLNLISEDVTDSGIAEMFVQKEPNQLIWCIKENGDACVMTYERGQQVRGWARITTDGEYYSAAAINDSGEDIVWACVKRDTKYCIEKFHLRKDLNWYVDSGKEFTSTSKSITASSISTDITITANSHGYSNGDFVRVKGTISDQINGNVFKVSDSATNTFKIKNTDASAYIFYNNTNNIIVSGAVESSTFNGTYELDSSVSTPFWNLKDSAEGINISVQEDSPTTHYWVLRNDDGSVEFQLGATQTSQAALLNTRWWEVTYDNSDSTKRAFRSATFSFGTGATVQQVYNEVTGLNHLEGKTVQVIGDGSFIKEDTVSSNKVTTDEYYGTLLAGLKFTSTLRPMPIEPVLAGRLSQSRVKAASKIIVRFFKTKGAKVGEAGRQLTTYNVVDTQDPAGQSIELKTEQQRFFVASDYEREKLIEVSQDLPYSMTVLSIASIVNVEGM